MLLNKRLTQTNLNRCRDADVNLKQVKTIRNQETVIWEVQGGAGKSQKGRRDISVMSTIDGLN